MNEEIVLVDNSGRPVGSAPKLASHNANTPLHLGFSCYLFNSEGKFLLTQRALSKKVWPGVWTNSVCGHPAPHETNEAAVLRRANYELGIKNISNLELVLPDYRYMTPAYNGIVENEICPVFFSVVEADLKINPDEVEDFSWVDWQDLDQMINDDPEEYSYWFKDQFKQLQALDLRKYTRR